MLSTDVIVNNFAQTLIAGIQSNIRNKRVTEYGSMNASGTMADSLKYKWDGKTLVIFSTEKYFTVLETGRAPSKRGGGNAVGERLIDKIELWLDQKPVAVQDISKKSLAYLIARKIHKEGSLLYRQGGNSGVISDYINQKYVTDNLTEKLFQAQIELITNQFLKAA
jgi:hypothetical protein